MQNKTIIGVILALAGAFSLAASDLYVDDDNYGKSGLDGRTPEKAYGTIQKAIEQAAEGDVIHVLPGVYNKDSVKNPDATNGDVEARVFITKPLTIVSTEGAEVTHIVGALDPNGLKGAGSKAVRCVRFNATAASSGSVLKGFTIRDGGCLATTATDYGGDSYAGQPGGVTGPDSGPANQNFYVTDCVVSNCVGVRGGLIRYGKYVRCRFSDGLTNSGQAAGRGATFLHCLFSHFNTGSIIMDGKAVVNCTFADMSANAIMSANAAIPIVNSLFGAMPVFSNAAENTNVNMYNISNCYLAKSVTGSYVEQMPMFSPLTGDFRLRADSRGVGLAMADLIGQYFTDAPEIVDPYLSLDGVKIPANGPINVGCFQRLAPKPSSGALVAGAAATCRGYSGVFAYLYAHAETPYELFKFTAVGGNPVFAASSEGNLLVPDMDDTVTCLVPAVGHTVTNGLMAVQAELYVSPTGSDTTGTGTQAKPYGTLQKAVDKASSGTFTLIHAAAGDYNKGGAVMFGITNRVAIEKNVRLKGAGRGASTIWGASDPNAVSGANGQGPAAVRCVALSRVGYAIVQGFTIRGGHTDYSPTNTDGERFSGGLVRGNDERGEKGRCRVADCELTDGVAFRGALGMFVSFVRSVIHDMTGMGGGIARTTGFENCLMYDNLYSSDSHTVNSTDSTAYQCTFVADRYPAIVSTSMKASGNNIYQTRVAASVSLNSQVTNCVFSGYASVTDVGRNLHADAGFTNPTTHDYRLCTLSPVFAADLKPFGAYWKYSMTDVYGAPMRFPKGRVIPGAVQTPANVVAVLPPPRGTIKPAGTNVVEEGSSLTVTYTPDPSRPCYGIAVNGEKVTDEMTYTYLVGSPFNPDGSMAPAVSIAAIVATNWYVNAISGDDANDGFSPEKAWRRLTRLHTASVMPGDCVHAAPGDYKDGVIIPSDATVFGAVPVRVEVPKGVTLVADEGPEATFITGEADIHATESKIGNGPGAVRCVALNENARLTGFTVRDGHVFQEAATEGVNSKGGGVIAKISTVPSQTAVIDACVITNCAARRGAVCGGRIVNSMILDCYADACSPAGYETWFYNCFIDSMHAYETVRNCYGISNCTFGPNCTPGTAGSDLHANGDRTVKNCIFMSLNSSPASSISNKTYSNCVFVAMSDKWSKAGMFNCKFPATVAELKLDSCGFPAQDSPVVDAGCAVNHAPLTFGCAANGVHRVYNGATDIGCYEYDWRPVYKRDIGRDAYDLEVDPQVVESPLHQVLIREGKVEITLPVVGGRDTRVATLVTEVTGAGYLSVCVNGEVRETYTRAHGVKEMQLTDFAPGRNVVTLVYEKDVLDTDDVGALVSRFACTVPGFMIMYK